MGINIGTLYKKSILRDTSGNIINWIDEADGGYIIRNRQVVNEKKYNEYVQKEKDKRTAVTAVAEQVVASPEAQALRSGKIPLTTPSKTTVDELKKKVDNMESKLDAILSKLK